MKYFRRCFCVLCSFLLLLIAFSSIVSAENLESGSYSVDVYLSDAMELSTSFTFTPNNGVQEAESQRISSTKLGNYYVLTGFWKFYNNDNSNLIRAGQEATISLSNAYFSAYYSNRSNSVVPAKYYRNPTFEVLVYYADGTHEYIECTYTINVTNCYVNFSFIPRDNVTAIQYNFENRFETSYTYEYVTYYMGETDGDECYNLSIEQASEEVGLLGGIKDILSSVINWLTDILNSIKELPTKIWNKIESGLQSLFVPSEESMTDFKSRMESMLNERLGAVYEVVEITFDSWERVGAFDLKDTIEMPLTTINLPGDETFSFGGYDVKVVPDGFEFIAIATKTITAILASVAFVNGLRKRYDEVMGVEQ